MKPCCEELIAGYENLVGPEVLTRPGIALHCAMCGVRLERNDGQWEEKPRG